LAASDAGYTFVYGFLGPSNILRGSVKNGIFHADGRDFPLEMADGASGHATAFIRPHDLLIERGAPTRGIPAQVRRILAFGAVARVELSGLTGEPHFEVEPPERDLVNLNLSPGETIQLVPKTLRVFPQGGAGSR